MGRLFEVLILRGLLYVGLPLLLVLLAFGPSRCWGAVRRLWGRLWQRRQEPVEVLGQVVKQYKAMVATLNQTLARARSVQGSLERNISKSEENLAALDAEARQAARQGDDLEAKAVLFKINLEKQALASFREQKARHARQVDELRRNLYAVELQLRQYEVGRELLLSQLAEAKTVEQQYRIASEFDPFSAVASWRQAENMVEEKQLSARAIGRVEADLREALRVDGPAGAAGEAGSEARPAAVDPQLLETQLQDLKRTIRQKE